jgi:hypothetical protein
MMNAEEARMLAALDRQVDADPMGMTPQQIQRYRELLARYVSQMSSGSFRAGDGRPAVCGARQERARR